MAIQTGGRLANCGAQKDDGKGAAISCCAVEGRVYGLEGTRKGKRRSEQRAEQRKKFLYYRHRLIHYYFHNAKLTSG